MAITFRFQVGDVVEAMDNSPHAWRLATIERRAAYRGREGYYVLWVLAPDAQSWVSRGGWFCAGYAGAGLRAAHPLFGHVTLP